MSPPVPTSPPPAPAARVASTPAADPPAPADPARAAKNGDGFFSKMKKSLASSGSKKSDVPAIETEVDGDFRGWGQATVWKMKDGSVWRVDNLPQPYFTKVTPNPRVRITRAILGGYWLEFVDLDLKVRVQELK